MAQVELVKAAMALSSVGKSPFRREASGGGSHQDSVAGEETDSLITQVKNSVLFSIAMTALVSAIVSLVILLSTSADIASIFLMGIAPLSIYQKLKLKSLGGMRAQQNRLRKTVNEFSVENDKLSRNVDDLGSEVNSLQGIETELDIIAHKSGANADRLVNIIQENEELLAKVKRNLQAQVMISILTAVLRSDTDEDFMLSKSEMRRLEYRLGLLPGVQLNKAAYKKFVHDKEELHLHDLMDLFRNLKDDSIPDEDNIFKLAPNELL